MKQPSYQDISLVEECFGLLLPDTDLGPCQTIKCSFIQKMFTAVATTTTFENFILIIEGVITIWQIGQMEQ